MKFQLRVSMVVKSLHTSWKLIRKKLTFNSVVTVTFAPHFLWFYNNILHTLFLGCLSLHHYLLVSVKPVHSVIYSLIPKYFHAHGF